MLGIAAFIIYYPGFYITSFVIEGSEHVSSAEIMDGVDKAIGEHFIFGIGGSTAHWFGLRYGAMENESRSAIQCCAKFVSLSLSFSGCDRCL